MALPKRPEKSAAHCTGCIFHIGIFVNSLLFPVEFKCPHRNENSVTATYKRSKVLSVIAIFPIFTIVAISVPIGRVLWEVCENDKGFCLIVSTDLLYGIIGFSVVAFSLKNTKLRILEFNAWSRLLEARESFGISTILTEENAKRLTLTFYKSLAANFTITALIASYYYYILDDDLSYKSLRCLLMVSSILIQGCLLAFMSVQSNFLILFYSTLQRHIFDFMKSYDIERDALVGFFTFKKRDVNLGKLSRFIMAAWANCTPLIDVYKDMFIVFFLFTIGNLIASCYLSVTFFGSVYVKFLIIIVGRTLLTIMGIVQLLFLIEEPSIVSKSVISSLFMCPLSKMSRSDAIQVEALITCLVVQKPHISPYEIFYLDSKLLSSVCSTVLTYVLIAVQFKISSKI